MAKKDNLRQSKISYLRGLLRGGRSIEELRTPRHPFLLAYADRPGYYKELPSGVIWHENDIEEYELKHPGDHVFLMFKANSEGDGFERSITEFIERATP